MPTHSHKRPRDPESPDDADHSTDPTHDHMVSVIRFEPELCAPSPDDDPSVDPATLPVVQWSGPCSLNGNLPKGILQSQGTLIVANPRIYWWCASEKIGLAINYHAIAMHAVHRTTTAHNVYCQLSVNLLQIVVDQLGALQGIVPSPTTNENAAHVEFADDEYSELNLVPSDPAQLDDLFSALCLCASMHPDSADDDDGDFDDLMDMMHENAKEVPHPVESPNDKFEDASDSSNSASDNL